MTKTYENFEEWLKEHDAEIRADERKKTLENLISALEEKHKDDNSWCEYDINIFIIEIENFAEQMKGVQND